MRRRLSIRAIVGIITGLVALAVAGLASYAFLVLLPSARELRQSTQPLLQLFGRLSEGQQWLGDALNEANLMLSTSSPGPRLRLRATLAARDQLVGVLPLAAVPAPVRIPLARAEEAMSRLVVLLDETVTLVELGRRADARQRLAEANALRARVVAIMADAELRGLDDVMAGQARLESLNRQFVAITVAWLLICGSLVALGITVVRARFAEHLGALQDGLDRVSRGDLSVTIKPRAADELAALTQHFNQMTLVLRDRAERQGQVAAAGELLAGAAHEVNNPLMAIVATAEMRLADPTIPPGVRTDLENLIGEAQRAGHLVRGIVKFIRQDSGEKRPTDFNEVVRDAWDLVWFQFRADGVKGRMALSRDLPPVLVNAQKLEQVFVNLLCNAHQAVVSGGGPREIELRTFARDGRVVAEVADSGQGVPEAIAGQLFRPFFSTRTGEHVGLGLYTSRLIAREAGGDVEYRPAERGAVFTVWLPALPPGTAVVPTNTTGEFPAVVRGAAVAAPAGSAPPTGSRLAGLRVLVVDDEAMVRRPIARFLAKRGAWVREAGEGREALAAISIEVPDLVLTDLRMPVMDGVALYREVLRSFPKLAPRVFFLSGDVAALAQLPEEQIPPERVFRKPIELADLEDRLSRQLG